MYFCAILFPPFSYLQEGQVSNSFLAAQMPQTICPSLFDTHHEKNHKIILNTLMNGKVKYWKKGDKDEHETPVANLLPVSLTSVVHLDLRISPRIFEKIRNDPIVIIRGLGEGDSWKKPSKKSRDAVPLS